MKQPAPVKVKLPKRKPDPVAPFPEHGHVCLNCGHEVSNNFCSVCGQSTATHRLSIKHFLLHDLVHSIWHVDRGIFFTLKDVVIRPGYAALEYIRGKRSGRFPILTLLLLLVGLTLWLYSLGKPEQVHDLIRVDLSKEDEFRRQIVSFMKHNQKWLLLMLIPIASLSALIVFRRTRLNYTEQVLLSSYIFGGLLISLIFIRLIVLALPRAAGAISGHGTSISFLFFLFGYWQAYHKVYRLPGLIWRYCLFCILSFFFLLVFAALAVSATILSHPELTQSN
jgi:hypothetical protein